MVEHFWSNDDPLGSWDKNSNNSNKNETLPPPNTISQNNLESNNNPLGSWDKNSNNSNKNETLPPDIFAELTQEQFDTVLDELQEKSLVVQKILWEKEFVLKKDTFKVLHDSNNPNTDVRFWNTKNIEFVLTCKNFYDFLSTGQNRSKLQEYLKKKEVVKSDDPKPMRKILEIKNNLHDYCHNLTETITVNSADTTFLYIDSNKNLFICKSPKVIQKKSNWLLPQITIKRWDFKQIDDQSTITKDGKLVTLDGGKIKYTPLIYIPELWQAEEMIVDNSVMKNDVWTILKNTTSDIAWITWNFVGVLSGTSNFARTLLNTYNTLNIVPHANNIKQEIHNLENANKKIDLDISRLYEEKIVIKAELDLDDSNGNDLNQSERSDLSNKIKDLDNQISVLKGKKIENEHRISELKEKLLDLLGSSSSMPTFP